jgi:hypothetical protein
LPLPTESTKIGGGAERGRVDPCVTDMTGGTALARGAVESRPFRSPAPEPL